MGNDALIGCLMIPAAFRVGYDNMVGLTGVSRACAGMNTRKWRKTSEILLIRIPEVLT